MAPHRRPPPSAAASVAALLRVHVGKHRAAPPASAAAAAPSAANCPDSRCSFSRAHQVSIASLNVGGSGGGGGSKSTGSRWNLPSFWYGSVSCGCGGVSAAAAAAVHQPCAVSRCLGAELAAADAAALGEPLERVRESVALSSSSSSSSTASARGCDHAGGRETLPALGNGGVGAHSAAATASAFCQSPAVSRRHAVIVAGGGAQPRHEAGEEMLSASTSASTLAPGNGGVHSAAAAAAGVVKGGDSGGHGGGGHGGGGSSAPAAVANGGNSEVGSREQKQQGVMETNGKEEEEEEKEEEEEEEEEEEVVVLYRGRWMRTLRILVRLKVLQLTAVAGAAVPLAYWTQGGQFSVGEVAAITAVVGGAGAASAALWYYSRRYVGELAIIIPPKSVSQHHHRRKLQQQHQQQQQQQQQQQEQQQQPLVRISTMDFWGNREDLKIALSDVVPPLEGMTQHEMAHASASTFLPLDVVGERQFILSVRHGRLVHPKLLLMLLDGSLAPSREGEVPSQEHTPRQR